MGSDIVLDCYKLVEAGILPPDASEYDGCCSSCHVDHEEFGYSMCPLYHPEQSRWQIGEVCCGIRVYLDNNTDAQHRLAEFLRVSCNETLR